MDKHFGELGLGSGRSGSSSRKGKKNSNSDHKPKQPQRGLGVAQLEKIRLHDQMAAAYLPPAVVLHSPFHTTTLNKEDDLREERTFSPSFYCSNSSSSSSSSIPYGLQANHMMMFGEDERLDIRSYGEFPSSSRTSSLYLPHDLVQEPVTLPLLEETLEDSMQKKRRQDHRHSTGSFSQNSDKSDTQELDLDLKL
ncbi:hypothetical protein J5N97_004420 [Dioscorea zingiberensis]|uniref:Uncharacterized protein n=1 Tax=Dioscorea zingiberensis TaxID=325984 RepID=A0A9D5D7V3_9LILI|nr:hypothetical protein J5N97_004420 [Dioscorea zingiberensis]